MPCLRNATILSLLLSCGALSGLAGQSLVNGALVGEVRAVGGAAIGGALVTLSDARGGATRSATTRFDGTFSFPLLSPGTYELLIEHLGLRPKRVRAIVVAASGTARVNVTLSGPPQGGPEVEDFRGQLGGTSPALVERWPSREGSPGVGDGLPQALSGLYWDGVATWVARHPSAAPARGLGLPAPTLSSVNVVWNGVDVEWSGAAGPIFSAQSARGFSKLGLSIAADATSDALTSSRYFDPGLAPGSSVHATATIGGPVIRDSAEFLIGINVQRLEEPRAPLWPANALSSALVDLAQDSFNIDLAPYTAPGVATTDAKTAFGRFDWRAVRNHSVSFHGLATNFETDAHAFGPGAHLTGRDYHGLLTISSVWGVRVSQELRLAYTRSTRVYDGADVPATRIVDAGLSFGGEPSLTGGFFRSTVEIADAVHVSADRHLVKVGVGVRFSSFDNTFADEASGAFVFAGASEFTVLRGVYRQAVGSTALARFSRPEFSGFLQDHWSAAPGLDLVLGVRVDGEQLPQDEVSRSDSLLQVTGLDNTMAPSSLTNVAPRFGMRWDLGGQGRWVVRAAAGRYHSAIDPGVLSEWITSDGGVRGRRGVGLLGEWPGGPDATAAPELGARFALLGPNFDAPRSTRVGLMLSRVIGTAALHVTGSYRHTDFLPRRADLNRLVAPAGTDQYGRPLYGTLVQQGSLLAGQANRRFPNIDRIWALNADGASDYWGLNVSLTRDALAGARFLASYTYSKTTDNWVGARAMTAANALNPFPQGVNGADWSSGRSDLDVPHRLLLGVEVSLPGPFALAGFYRVESGAPFTPAFRAGVDANGDGADDNDPAFVDDGVTGIPALLDEWDCLRTQAGEFAARNSCRDPGVHRLDLRLTMKAFAIGATPVQLVVEGLNLVESDVGLRDHALYLIDRTGAIATNGTTGVTTVPLIANPAFGDVLARRSSGRVIRLGVRLGGGA